MSDYCGYKVEIKSNQLGTVVGVVRSYNDNQIDLADTVVNGKSVPEELFTVQKPSIGHLKILSTTRTTITQNQFVEKTNQTPSSRGLRREKLRNIPGACTAYVSERSPPRVARTPQSQQKTHRKKSENEFDKLHRHQDVKKVNAGGLLRTASSSAADSMAILSTSFESINRESASGFESDSAASKMLKKNPRHTRARKKKNATINDGWDSLRIEDFIDTDFDFEANLALFDKKAFYEITDAKESGISNNGGHVQNFFSQEHKVLVEGPDGVGFEAAETTNRASTPSENRESPTSVPTFWYSSTGQKIPYLAPCVHERILHFLATGRDPKDGGVSLSMGFSWDRLIERAGLAIVNNAIAFLRQSSSHSFRRSVPKPHQPQQLQQSQRPPLRVLVLPGRRNLSGALAVNMARHLANRDIACVLLSAPYQSVDDPSLLPPYDVELTLAKTLAPRATSFLSAESKHYGLDDDEEEEEESGIPGGNDVELTSLAGRMWISRIPGLTVISKPSGVTQRPANALIDLLILGQPLEQYPTDIRQWLMNHKAICLAVQLGDLKFPVKEDSVGPPQALKTWAVQLGMPVIAPAQVPESVELQLVDVSMSRMVISRVTGDLRSLPPPALFDLTSCIQLKGSPS